MKKNVVNKIIAATLASALVVSMAACGDTKTSASGSIADASSSADIRILVFEEEVVLNNSCASLLQISESVLFSGGFIFLIVAH